jgi:dTDP-glucose 4,6-dehydratase/UDP-glucuronate decarboxylase
MKTAEQVVRADLDYMIKQGREEFASMSGRRVMIAGGAGFLGYYLVQAALHWNEQNPNAAPIKVIVLDNFIRGVPAWLTALERTASVCSSLTSPSRCRRRWRRRYHHAASIASPIYYRKYPIETMDANINGLRFMLDRCLAQKRRQAVGRALYSQRNLRRQRRRISRRPRRTVAMSPAPARAPATMSQALQRNALCELHPAAGLPIKWRARSTITAPA